MLFLIFTAFFMDHLQNEYLGTYFSDKVNKDIFKLKHSLEIVQSFLSVCEITSTEPEEDMYLIEMHTFAAEALNGGEYDDDEEDPDTWDAFRDAHKFEMLN